MEIQGASASNAAQVSVLNNQRQQSEAVIGRLIQGVEETPKPRAEGQTGAKLNVIA